MTSLMHRRLTLALATARLGTWTWDMAAGSTTWDVRLEELHGLPPEMSSPRRSMSRTGRWSACRLPCS